MDDQRLSDFHHPYTPYDIQFRFMNAVYSCIEDRKVGIFESPTGTGKSLSLICGSLTWLREHKKRTFNEGTRIDASHDVEPSWMVEHAQDQRRQEALRRKRVLEERIAKVKAKERQLKRRQEQYEPRIKRIKDDLSTDEKQLDETKFVLDEYNSDAEPIKTFTFNNAGLSGETEAILEKLGYAPAHSELNDEPLDQVQILYCSRTHSQLTQFSNELGRVKMPPAIAFTDPDSTDSPVEDVKYLTLGSRKNLCINPRVNRLGNATAINERCVELQQSSDAAGHCPFKPTQENEQLVHEFRDNTLAHIHDIEDLGQLGKRLGVCPYYASRPVVPYCEVVGLPYPLLLQKSAREALSLSLRDRVIIIDEAHNLMEAISGIYSVSITLSQVREARMQLTVYLQKFRNKLKGKNRVYVAQILRVLDSIITYMSSIIADGKPSDGIADMVSILTGKGIDQINMFKLNSYLQDSKLARKVDGYTSFADQASIEASARSRSNEVSVSRKSVPVLMHVQSFLLALTNPSAEGRFFFAIDEESTVTLRYLLLDPTFHFKDVVDQARAVILAGGTMSPMSDYHDHLLPYLASEKIMTLSCDHVVPSSSLLAVPIFQAMSGAEFNFTFANRSKPQTIVDLGETILDLACHIPDGVVVFFPSYSYLDTCIAQWKQVRSGITQQSFWNTLNAVKPIFTEERTQDATVTGFLNDKDAAVNSVLSTYSLCIANSKRKGALLFAVIGGSLSEGINFSDELGRGVVVVGLPFPNPHSAEWKAKSAYIATKETDAGRDGKAAARSFYENTCMRAVNQCIGRAIRHKADYAAIVLLDKRYGTPRIQQKLPQWIRGSLSPEMKSVHIGSALDQFFAAKA